MSLVTPSSFVFLPPTLRGRLLAILATAITAALFLFAAAALGDESATGSHQPDSLTSVMTRAGSHPGDAKLPLGIDPLDIMRTVQGNRAEMLGATQAVPAAKAAQQVGPKFQIGYETASVPAPSDQRCVAVASDGTDYLVVWSDARNKYMGGDIYGSRVSAEGVVIDPCGIPISTADYNQSWPAVAFDGTNYVVVWEDDRGYSRDIYGARVNTSGKVLDSLGVTICGAANNQYRPTIAFDGVNYMVAWQDWRSGSPDIYGARVSQSLSVLNPSGIAFCAASGDQYFPEIAFGSGEYLLVWQDFRSGSDWDIYGTRITTSGTVLDPAGIPILTGFSHQFVPDVASSGNAFMVVWADDRATGSDVQSDIYGTRVDALGNVLDPAGFAISTASYMQHWPAIAYDGTNYVVVWEDKRDGASLDIYASRVSPSGSVIDPGGVAISSAQDEQYYPAIAFNGTGYFVVWDDHRAVEEWDTFGTRLTTSAGVLDPAGIMISSILNEQEWPGIAFDGTNFLVVWYDTWTGTCDIYGARVDTSGNVLDPSGIIISAAPGDQALPEVAFDGTNFMVIWEDFRNGTDWDIYGARVSPAGIVLDPSGIPISTATSHQWSPSLGFDGTNFLVAWGDARSTGEEAYADIYGARVSKTGIVLDPSGFAISLASGMQQRTAIAFDGTNFMLVWQDTRSGVASQIYGARVTPSATVLDPDGIQVSAAAPEEYLPDIGFDGTNYFAVWEENRNGTYNFDIYGARLSTSGVVLDPNGIAISTAPYHQLYPSLVFDGTLYLVAWQDLRSGVYYDIYAARVKTSGSVLDPAGVPISIGEEHQLYPATGTSGPGSLFIAYSAVVPTSGVCSARRIVGNIWGGITTEPQCIGYWAFDEGGGTIATDSALANNGIVYDAAWVDGIKGKALSFDGVISYVRIPDIFAYNLTDELSVEAWIRMTPSQTSLMPNIFDKSHRAEVEPPYYSGYALCGSVDEDYSIGFTACNGTSCLESNSVVPLNDGTWHFIAGTFSSRDSAICFYLNGKLTTQQEFRGQLGVNYGDVFLGRWWYGGKYFSGIIDEVKIYPVALTEEEIAQHFTETYTGVNDDLTTPKAPAERVFLAQNSPNPFNPVTVLSFYLAEDAHIKLSIFDIGGKEVSVLRHGPASSGWHTVSWEAAGLSSGVYFVRLDAGEAVRVRKAVLLK